jgi:hypothetical protein
MNTGAVIVVSAGIVCATTIQYFLPSPYAPSGIVIIRPVPAVKVVAVEIIKLSHNLHTFLQAIIFPPLIKRGSCPPLEYQPI